MIEVKEAAAGFLANRRIAVTGVSRDPARHGANVVYRRLRDRGYTVYPVNPNTDEVEGDRSYASLRSIPEGVDAVVIGTSPEHSEATMREAVDQGIKWVWMHRAFGEGSVCDDATAYGRDHGVTVIDGGCPLMFAPTSDPVHRVARLISRLTGKIPHSV